MKSALEKFEDMGIIPIFVVKNSNANLVTDNLNELAGKYNSDMHWSYNFLNEAQRTNFFAYRYNKSGRNEKAFCYIKFFKHSSPQRIEIDLNTYNKYKDHIDSLMDSLYYLMIAQGNPRDTQLRPIYIAEMYAKETLKLINPYKLLKKTGLNPIMNEVRFGGR